MTEPEADVQRRRDHIAGVRFYLDVSRMIARMHARTLADAREASMIRTAKQFHLEKRIRFEASHQLEGHDGKCARLHGHSWQAVIICEGDAVFASGPKMGMLVDYSDLSRAAKPLLENFLDHHHLNDTLQLKQPTSELVAMWIYAELMKLVPGLTAIRVEETCTSSCEYRPAL